MTETTTSATSLWGFFGFLARLAAFSTCLKQCLRTTRTLHAAHLAAVDKGDDSTSILHQIQLVAVWHQFRLIFEQCDVDFWSREDQRATISYVRTFNEGREDAVNSLYLSALCCALKYRVPGWKVLRTWHVFHKCITDERKRRLECEMVFSMMCPVVQTYTKSYLTNGCIS